MRVQIAKLHRQLDATMIYVTHDQVEAMTLANRIVVFSAGRIEQIGTPLQLYTNPGNLFVATFIGSPKMNIIAMTDAGGVTKRVIGEGKATHLGIRPEHTSVTKRGGGVTGTIVVTEHLGADSFYHVETETGETIVARGELADGLREGDQVGMTFDPEQIHLFNAEGACLTHTP